MNQIKRKKVPLTVQLSPDISEQLRIEAERAGLSASAYAGSVLTRHVRNSKGFGTIPVHFPPLESRLAAWKALKAQIAEGIHLGGVPPKREELYDR